jgi:hypothetical protein
LRDHPKLTTAELFAVAAFVLVVGQLHLGRWMTVYLGFAPVAGCCVLAFAVLGGARRERPQTRR